MQTRCGWPNSEVSISILVLFSPPLPFLSFLLNLGYGKVSYIPILLFLKVPISKFITLPLSLFGAPSIPTLPSFCPSPSPSLPQPHPNFLVSDLFSFGSFSPAPSWNTPCLSTSLKLLVLEKFKKLVSPLLILNLSSEPLPLMVFSLPSQPIKSFPTLDLPLPPLISPLLFGNLCGS
jgi:hypothetical protein